jgi:pimeloyl-ACP methyl ester carboxylesterase
MALMAQDVIALLDRLHIEKAIIVGHSMGGYVTLAAWRLAPERFQGFGVVASHHKADPEQKQRDRYALAEAVEERGAEAALNPNLFSPSTPESSPARALVEQLTLATPPAGIIGALLGMASRPDSTALLETITVPGAVVTGLEDSLVAVERAREMALAMPDALLTVVNNAGHMPMLEQPDDVNSALRALLKRAG